MDPSQSTNEGHRGYRRFTCQAWAGAVLGAALLLGMALSACGASSGSAAGATSSATSGDSHGGTLTIATPSSPPSLDPATGANEYSDYFNLAYEPLIIQAANGEFEPGLAESWEYGPENKSFKITLRSGLMFSDGTPVDAKAVKTWIDYELKLPGGRGPTYLESLESIDVTGPLSLTLDFSAPTPLLELVFSQVLEMGMIGSPKAVAAESLATTTAGAGQYMLDSKATVTGSEYVYVPNPHYRSKQDVHWERVVVKTIASPTAALQALKTGQIQVAKDQPATSISAAESSGLKDVAPLTLLMGLSLMDREGKISKPLGDPKVRQAINYAIDREAVANVIGAGKGEAITQMAVEGDDSYDPALDRSYPYDVEKARELLAEAGYQNGFTLRTLSVAAVEQDKLAQALAGQLEKIGVTLEVDVRSDDYITQMASGKYPVATLSFGRLPAAIDYTLLWGPNAALFNPFKTTSSKLESLDRQLNAAPAEEASTIAKQMQAFTVEEAWFAPVVATPLVVLYSSGVTGVNATSQRNVIYTTEIEPAS